jgi:hypothetical protein
VRACQQFQRSVNKKCRVATYIASASEYPVGPSYGEPNAVANAIGYAEHRSRSHDAVICVYDDSGSVIETHEPAGEAKNGEFCFLPRNFVASFPYKTLKRTLLRTSGHGATTPKYLL